MIQIIVTYKVCAAPYDPFVLGTVLYASFILVTNLWCTLLIIYRIVTVIRAGNNAGGGLGTYRHVIELLVESAALYSIFAILYVICFARHNAAFYYFTILATIAKVCSYSFCVFAFNIHHIGSCTDTPRWTHCSRSFSST